VARTEDEARQRGAADGLTVDAVELLPPASSTADQLALASSLGRPLPEGLDWEAMSDWIARIQHKDKLAAPSLRDIASAYGLDMSEQIGKRRLFSRLFVHLSEPGREHDLAAWFTFRVYRELVKGRYDVAITTPADPAVQAIAKQLQEVQGVTESSVINHARRDWGLLQISELPSLLLITPESIKCLQLEAFDPAFTELCADQLEDLVVICDSCEPRAVDLKWNVLCQRLGNFNLECLSRSGHSSSR
jgi:hypothetical protein